MQPARPVNRPRPNANPASPGGAPAKVESRAFFIPPIFAPATPSRSIDGGVPVFDREKCGHCGACIWNRAQPLPDNPERTDIAFRAGAGGLYSAENPSAVRSEIFVESSPVRGGKCRSCFPILTFSPRSGQSARGLAQSKTLRAAWESSANASRLGVRWPSTAFLQRTL